MIGSRVAAAAAAVVLVIVLGGGAPRPEVAVGARAAVLEAADDALIAIDRLQLRLAPAMDAARSGAARVVAGSEDPREPLSNAADGALGAAEDAAAVRAALAELDRARHAMRPDASTLPPLRADADLPSIAGQLDAAAEAGASYARSRIRAEAVSTGLLDALDAIAAGRPDQADADLQAARDSVSEVRELQAASPALAVWIDTADAMIRAMQRLVDAVRDGDPGEAAAARGDFDAAAEGAPEADRALRIGLGEAGSAVTAVPLARLAQVLAGLDELEAAVRAAREEAGE